MVRFFSVVAFALLFVVATGASAADKAKKGGTRGTVKSVDKDSVKIAVQGAKKGSGTGSGTGSGSGSAEEKTFKVTSNTKYETLEKAAKGQKPEPKDAKAEDVKVGSVVMITANGDTATKVSITKQAKKEKKAKKQN